jgi:hypothetical protein
MIQDTSEKKMTVDLRTGRKLVFTIIGEKGIDSEKICITITHEAKAGRVARLNVVAPSMVKIGFS